MRALLAALLARLGAGALAVLELEQEHQRAVVVRHLLADLLAAKEVRPRPRLAGPQFEIVGILPVALRDDVVAALAEGRIFDTPAPRRAVLSSTPTRAAASRKVLQRRS